ncbi:2080_t:CDS:1, partial [Acaulospora colombiana]
MSLPTEIHMHAPTSVARNPPNTRSQRQQHPLHLVPVPEEYVRFSQPVIREESFYDGRENPVR